MQVYHICPLLLIKIFSFMYLSKLNMCFVCLFVCFGICHGHHKVWKPRQTYVMNSMWIGHHPAWSVWWHNMTSWIRCPLWVMLSAVQCPVPGRIVINTACPSITTPESMMPHLGGFVSLIFTEWTFTFSIPGKMESREFKSGEPTAHVPGSLPPVSFWRWSSHPSLTVLMWRDGSPSWGNHSGDLLLACQVQTLINHRRWYLSKCPLCFQTLRPPEQRTRWPLGAFVSEHIREPFS